MIVGRNRILGKSREVTIKFLGGKGSTLEVSSGCGFGATYHVQLVHLVIGLFLKIPGQLNIGYSTVNDTHRCRCDLLT